MTSIVVTGTNAGMGLGFVKELLKYPEVTHIFATARDPTSSASAELRKVADESSGRIHLIPLELTEKSAAAAAAEVKKVLGDKGVDILVNNIGQGQGPSRPEETTPEMLREVFEVNVVGTQVVTLAFLPLLRAGKKKIVVNVSTLVASMTYNDGRHPWKATGYGVSKAALNFLTTDYAKDLKDEGFTVVALYPGWAKTRQAEGATDTVENVSKGNVKVVLSLTPEDNGKFCSFDGTIHSW